MNCFPCFQNKQQAENNDNNNNNNNNNNDEVPIAEPKCVTTPPPRVDNNLRQSAPPDSNNNSSADQSAAEGENSTVKVYTFRELATATKNFRQECLLGEGGFGRVFRGTLTPSGQIVAVRQLDRNGTLGNKEFQLAVSSLSQLSHPNLVKLTGYCADGEQRILVYEYVPSGSLKNHLFELQAGKKPMNWSTRMKVALGIAEGLEYLHEKAEPPIIYRDLKSSNVLLDEANNARLSEYGLAKLVQSGNNKMPRVMTAYGYCAPEYERNGELTVKSDVYSFGVVLLELITGRQAFDASKPTDEQNLVSWAQPIFRDPSRFPDMADTLLRKDFPVTSLNQAIGVAAMCIQEEPQARPLISDISAALAFLVMAPPEAPIPARLLSILSSRVDSNSQFGDHNSMRLSNFSSHCKVEQTGLNSVADDEEDRESLSDDDNGDDSDYEYNEEDDDNGSCSTDHEERSMIKYENGKSSKQKDSKKWGSSSSKRKSKNKSQSKGRIHSRSSSRSRSRNSNDNTKSHHDDNDYDHSSSSDEQGEKEGEGSFNRRHSHRTRSGKASSQVTSIGNKSRNKSSKKSLHSKSIGSSSSGNDSSSSRNASPRKHGHDVERSDDEREFVYSRKDSVMDSESDDDGDDTYHH